MAIIKYVPKKTTVRDRRNDQGGYYEATCEECGSLFYPAKMAKYCSQLCTQRAYNKRKRAGLVNTRQPKAVLDEKVKYAKNVSTLLLNRYPDLSEEFLADIRTTIRYLPIDEHHRFNKNVTKHITEDVYIYHTSMAGYRVIVYR